MKTYVLLGAIALCAASAANAQAPGGLALFQQLCIAPRADAAAVAAAAQTAGFRDPPAELKAKLVQDIAGAKMDSADVRFLPGANSSLQVLAFGSKQAGQGDPFPVAVRLNLCFLVTPLDIAAEKALADWVAVPADKTVANATAFDFVGDKPHRPITGLSAADAGVAAGRGELQVAATQEQSNFTVLIYGRNQP